MENQPMGSLRACRRHLPRGMRISNDAMTISRVPAGTDLVEWYFDAGLDRRAAGRAADRRNGRCLRRRARRRARVPRVPGAAALWRAHPRGAGDQHGDGRLQAGIRACRARRDAGADHPRLQSQRCAGDDAYGRAAARRERADRARDRHERRRQRLRLGQPRQRDDRPGDPARPAQCRRRHGRATSTNRPLGHPGKYTYCVAENEAESPLAPYHVEKGFAPEDFDRLRHRRRAAAQRHQSCRRRSRRHPRQHLFGDEHDRPQQRGLVRPLRRRSSAPSMRARSRPRAGPGTT